MSKRPNFSKSEVVALSAIHEKETVRASYAIFDDDDSGGGDVDSDSDVAGAVEDNDDNDDDDNHSSCVQQVTGWRKG